jgi:glycosyltransferase involved in cell wall biosynthesis
LLIDDGSTDSSRAVAEEAARRTPASVIVLSHPNDANRGLPATRNLGLRHGRSEFVALLDADDMWMPSKLEQQVAILRNHPQAGMVFGRSEYWYSWDAEVREDDSIPQLAPGDRLYDPPELWKLCYPFGGFGSPCPSDLLFRRSTLEKLGGFEECFDRRYPTYEDVALLSKVFLTTPVYVSNQCWDRYRRHDESIWARAQQDGGEERSRAFYFQWMRKYLDKNSISDPSVRELYRQRSWNSRHRVLAQLLEGVRYALRPIKRVISSR